MSSVLICEFRSSIFRTDFKPSPVVISVVWEKHLAGTQGIEGFEVRETAEGVTTTLSQHPTGSHNEDKAIKAAAKQYRARRTDNNNAWAAWQAENRAKDKS